MSASLRRPHLRRNRIMVDSDIRSIEDTLNGHPEAFADLVVKYQDRLFSALLHTTSDPACAEEIAQEAFVTAFVKLAGFRQASSFYTWLYRIAFNLLATAKRRERTQLSLERDLAPVGAEPASGASDPSQNVAEQERNSMLIAALDAISPQHREILILRELEGCDYEAIAEILDISVGTVRSRLHRAREQLREALQPIEEKLW